ncbi:MAG: hypothetical protein BGO82_05515 [Devosia sp. 67-54]|uniref:hypothetical protein n=1 Tax=unclassified Devosia TaxID=196773 RepID=UPI0009651690|nr:MULTISPECIES: hypothetical protein [unclassified Devosia]MBN9306925.1 hypothetical protein [Devosia sp.]OJX16978.1 MAG: hypothetical protein BGO82_05515 [Devosia sp. 67-54]
MDLFSPIVPEDRQHPNFKRIGVERNGYNCDVLNDWARGFPDRDGKFVREFQTTFDSSFWELYLFAGLKQYGFAMDFSHPAPDFSVTDGGGFNIEATIASHAQGSPPEHAKEGHPVPDDLNEFNRQAIIRLRNAIEGKHRKFVDSYQHLPHVKGRPFVLAIAGFDSPYAMLAGHRPIEAALLGYYVDEERFLREGGKLKGKHIDWVTKDNGAPIEVGVFMEPAYSWLSAVVCNPCATWGKVRALSADPNPAILFQAVRYNPHGTTPHTEKALKATYRERLLEGLRVYHNPEAQHPLDPATFRHRDVFQTYWSESTGNWVYEIREGHLQFRTVLTTMPRAAGTAAGLTDMDRP